MARERATRTHRVVVADGEDLVFEGVLLADEESTDLYCNTIHARLYRTARGRLIVGIGYSGFSSRPATAKACGNPDEVVIYLRRNEVPDELTKRVMRAAGFADTVERRIE